MPPIPTCGVKGAVLTIADSIQTRARWHQLGVSHLEDHIGYAKYEGKIELNFLLGHNVHQKFSKSSLCTGLQYALMQSCSPNTPKRGSPVTVEGRPPQLEAHCCLPSWRPVLAGLGQTSRTHRSSCRSGFAGSRSAHGLESIFAPCLPNGRFCD